MALPLIGVAISGLISLAGDWFQNKKEEKQARHERDIAIIKGKQKLAEGEQSHNSAWELEALKKASKPLRWSVAATILAPMWVTMWDEEKGKAIFEALKDAVPDQWWWLFLILCGFAFASKNLIEMIKSGTSFWKK